MVELSNENPIFKDFICNFCFFPKEYCEFSHSMLIKKKVANKDTIGESKQLEESKEKEIEAPKDEEKKDMKNSESKQEVGTEKKKKNKETTKIVIEESKRGKRKHITYITHLEKFGINLKDISKVFSKKFACSANVTKDETEQESITLTGEFAIEIKEFLVEKYNIKEKDIKVNISN